MILLKSKMIESLLKPLIGPLLDKALDLIPNENERSRAKEKLEGDILSMVARADSEQAKINQVEAAHKSIFVAGWRPFIGWVCGISIAWSFLVYPIMDWALVVLDTQVRELPKLDTDQLYQLVLAMLGMGGLRTFEKIKKVSREK